MGGGTLTCTVKIFLAEGLSPRGRGNLNLAPHIVQADGSIPAWAGEPDIIPNRFYVWPVYPRVGGGTTRRLRTNTCIFGLSPRGRGNLGTTNHAIHGRRSIPAWAGEPLLFHAPPSACGVYPRVGGGTLNTHLGLSGEEGLSPRGRGNPGVHLANRVRVGSIPAWAGEPAGCPSPSLRCGVYPRVGGGTRKELVLIPTAIGLSPRGRGNRELLNHVDALNRSIPAWAGEPAAAALVCQGIGVYPRVGGGTSISGGGASC